VRARVPCVFASAKEFSSFLFFYGARGDMKKRLFFSRDEKEKKKRKEE